MTPQIANNGTTMRRRHIAAANYCRPYNGGNINKTSGTASTQSTGAELSGAIGIHLSSRGGWTKSASLKITLTGSKRTCGTNAYPAAATADRLIVKAP